MSDDWFEQFYERYFDKVLGYFRRSGFPRNQAEELTQDTFVRVYANRRSLVGKEAKVEISYLMTAARSVRLNELRRIRAIRRTAEVSSLDGDEHPIDPPETGGPWGPPSMTTEEKAAWARRHAFIVQKIRQLPDRERRALMSRVAGLSYGEIKAAYPDIGSKEAVRALLKRARQRLREALSSYDGSTVHRLGALETDEEKEPG